MVPVQMTKSFLLWVHSLTEIFKTRDIFNFSQRVF